MGNKELTAEEAKAEIIKLVGLGKSASEATRIVGKSRATYDYYRRTDPEFTENIERQKILISRGKGATDTKEVPDFPEFCEKYLKQKLFPHQLQWYDILEGREPRDLHPSMNYQQGDPDLLVVNTPPGHAKSTTFVNYCVWRIVKDPDVKILLVSATKDMAVKFLLQIKNRLTHPMYVDLQKDFAPPGGWDGDSASWKQDLIYVSSNIRGGEAKDPTAEAIGIGGQIYGARADLILLDDVVLNKNAHEYEKQFHWIQTEVMSRIPDGGKLVVIGTRMAPKDLYKELLNADLYHGDDESPWTYFSQPAVLEFSEEAENWKTLWPKTDAPSGRHIEPDENGLYVKWDGPSLFKRRARMTPSAWARVYQQEQVAEDTIFDPEAIRACQQMRHPGLIPADETIGRDLGMEGLRIIAGLDPAAVGYTAAVVIGFDNRTGKRWVIDVFNKVSTSPEEMRTLIKEWTVRYGINEWRIERNAFQAFLTRDADILSYLASRGATLTEHTTTGSNKHDPNFGVMAMSGLFSQQLISLPNSSSEAMKAMVEQLSVWQPDPPRGTKTDIVMALWFAEIRAQELASKVSRTNNYINTPFTTRGDIAERVVVGYDEHENQLAGAVARSWWGK